MRRVGSGWYVPFLFLLSQLLLVCLEMAIGVLTRLALQIAESGLPLHAFDSFEDAAKKVIALAKE